MSRMLRSLVLALAALAGLSSSARACPFCSAVSLTFAQEIAQSKAAVIARLVEPPAAGSLSPRAQGPLPKGKFEVVEVLKGEDLVSAAGHSGSAAKPIETIMLDDKPVGSMFLLMAVEPPELVWSSPIRVGDRAVEYLRRLASLPEKGPDRLAFFRDYLEDEEESLARDAYDEFAVAPYADIRGLADRMDPTRLLGWIENPKVQANRRRLYATMLGACGTPADADRIGAILEGKGLAAEQAEIRGGLDALIACFVALRGPAALDLVDRLFLRRSGRDVPFAETYAAVMALRFLGEESDLVSRERVLESLRILLDEPKLADLVIADLARWQDWSAVDKLAGIFKEAQADNIFVREPIVNYLRACPRPEAATALVELEKIDPEAVRRAATLAGLAGAVLAPAPTGGDEEDEPAGTGAVTAPEEDPSQAVAQVPEVLGDDGALEPATDRAVEVPPAKPMTPPTARPATWKWVGWAIAVLVVAILARSAMRPGQSAAR